MNHHIPQNALDFLKRYNVYLLIGHTEPDGDCLGTQLALRSLLERLGKKAWALQDLPFDRPETQVYEGLFRTDIPENLDRERTAVVVLDCSTTERVSERFKPLLSRPVLVIDHHAAGEEFGLVRFVEPAAASTTSLVARLYQGLDLVPTGEEAAWLFFGLATDTGFFRHCEKGFSEVFSTALFLVEHGASPKAAYLEMYGNRSFQQRKLLGRLLENAENHCDGRLVLTWQTLAETAEAGPNVRSSEELYNLFQTVAGVEVIVLLREETQDLVSVGLRSLNCFDVSEIARQYGGGGHRLAAGFNFDGTLDQAKVLVLSRFKKDLTVPC
jgi:phosphoesterase RecJ-like protein